MENEQSGEGGIGKDKSREEYSKRLKKIKGEYERKFDEIDKEFDEKASRLEEMVKGLKIRLEAETKRNNQRENELGEQLKVLCAYCLSREAESRGTEGKSFPYLHLVLKDDGDISAHDLNRAMISLLKEKGYSEAEFIRQNGKNLIRAIVDLKNSAYGCKGISIMIRNERRKMALERITLKGMPFTAAVTGIPAYYCLYDENAKSSPR